jgi:cysteine desulfuration protein SufE
MSIATKEAEIIEEFELFDDCEGKYEYIIDLGKKLPKLSDEHKNEYNIIKGCQSIVWLHAYKQDGKLHFEADSEAIIVKGLVSMLVKVMTNHTPEEILESDLYFIDKIGLASHLAQTRSNGLASMVKKMRSYAVAYSSL